MSNLAMNPVMSTIGASVTTTEDSVTADLAALNGDVTPQQLVKIQANIAVYTVLINTESEVVKTLADTLKQTVRSFN